MCRRCTSTSRTVEDLASCLKERSYSCTGIVATWWSSAKRTSIYLEGKVNSVLFSSGANSRSLCLIFLEGNGWLTYGTSYWSLIATSVLSCRISEILKLLLSKATFPHATPIRAKIVGVPFGVDLWYWGLQRERTTILTNYKIIFEEFQPMWSQYFIVTDRWTDGQLAIAIPFRMLSITW